MEETCKNIREQILDFVSRTLFAEKIADLQRHINECENCGNYLRALQADNKLLSNFAQSLQPALTRLEDNVINTLAQTKPVKPAKSISVWRIIMKSPITKLAAAACIIIAVTFGLNIVFNKSVSTAYALEQTIKASHSIRYIYVRNSIVSHEEPMEFWLEFEPDGQLKNMRFHKPAWMEPDDGATIIVWKDNKMQLWIEKKKFLVTLKDEQFAEQVLKTAEQFDPKFAVQRLQKEQKDGRIELIIEEPADKTEPIVITATSLEKDDSSPFQRVVLFVDQATRLVNMVELYKLENGKYQKAMTSEYFDYNQPIEPKMFTLEGEVPTNATRIDQTMQEVGLVQGNLSNEEVAAEVIRQFLQALIDKDYAKAGRLFSGVPAERMEKTYGQIRFIRIISIGKPVPHSLTGGLYVPCTVEIEENGKIIQWHPEHSYVRQVHGQPNRWEIIGGFRGI